MSAAVDWKALGLTTLSGLLLTASMPGVGWSWLAWLSLIPFLSLFPFRSKRSAFGYGLLLAAIYSAGLVYWVIVFAAPQVGLLRAALIWLVETACESVFFGAWTVGTQWLHTRSSHWAWRLGVPALWVLVVEWLRQLGPLGLTWGDLACSQYAVLPFMQLTKLTGFWGLSFLIVLVNVALAELLTTRRIGKFSGCVAALVALSLGYGFYILHTEQLRPAFVAAALQGNVDQNVKHDVPYARRVLRIYSGLSRDAAARGAALTVWPETAYPGYLLSVNEIDLLWESKTMARSNRQVMVVGSAEQDAEQGKDWNTLFLIDAQGNASGNYRKRRLVPFGEYVPGMDWLPFLGTLQTIAGNRYESGADVQPLMDGGPVIGKLGAAVCFESSYPEPMREQVARGAGLLVVSTDDTWFGHTSEVSQHAAFAAMQAAETDRYLIRSAATGVSQIVDPTGRVVAESSLFQAAVVSAPVESRATLTPYVRWGDWFVGVCAVILALTIISPTLLQPHKLRSGR